MKSSYIITMHCPLNYGAILQAYALQTYLESLGLKVGIINYQPNYIVCDQSLMYIGRTRYKKNIFTKWAYRFIKAPSKLIRRRNFASFANRQLHLTPTYRTYEDIVRARLDADYFICGSDQIWNIVSGAHKDPSYFLAFVPDDRMKISYAASGNLPLIDDIKNITFPMINRINRISMRENTTIESIQPFIEKTIYHVCDPVFLLGDNIWRKLYNEHSAFKPTEDYVLVYPMGNGIENTISQAYHIAKHMELPLYMISASKRKDSRVNKCFNIDPYVFLSLIDNTECLVTNSFHGISFSIILEKQFWACSAEGSNHRITSLLEIAGLEQRLLIGNEKPNLNKRIDTKKSKCAIDEFIKNSKSFIIDSLQMP